MGQEISMMCPVCKERKATYKDVFKAICPDLNTYLKYQNKSPPFEDYLGPDCLKYMYQTFPLRWNRHPQNKEEPYLYWIFYSCDKCIFINDINRNEKFSEYNPSGVTMWQSQLP